MTSRSSLPPMYPGSSHREQRTTVPTNQELWAREFSAAQQQFRETPQNHEARSMYYHMLAREPVQGSTTHSDNPSRDVRFGREPYDLSGSIKGKGPYPNSTGAHADVWKCVCVRTGVSEPVAVKAVRLVLGDLNDEQQKQQEEKIIRRLRGEVHIWMDLHHPNILPLYGVAYYGFGPLPALVCPWADNGTLTLYLRKNPLSVPDKMKILAQVADALHYFHQKQLCHGDLTGNNVLIDRRGDALISDFGLSFILAEANTTSYFKSCRAGAVRFIAPEVIRAAQEDSGPPKGTHKSDIYSYGCLILQVLTGEVPYHRYRTEYLVQAAKMRGEPPECLTTFHSSLSNVVRFMQTCWANEPQERPELTSIKSLLARLAPQPAQQRHRR